MESLATISFLLGVVAYSVAATLFFMDIARRERAPGFSRLAPRAQGAGTTFHLSHLVLTSFFTETCPVESLPFALSLSAVVMSLAYLVLGARFGLSALGVAVAPLALTFLVGAQFVGGGVSGADNSHRVLLMLHITSNLLGFAVFILAGAAGAFYLVQERRLKAKRGHVGGRLPALDVLDTTEHYLLLIGFPLLTFGVVTGAAFLSGGVELTAAAALRSALAYLSWLVLAGVLLMRTLAGWRGRKTAYGTLGGVACVLLLVVAYVVRASSGAA